MRQHRNKGSRKFLVTSALPYANGDIHLGHMLEAVQTDIFVRYQKLRGHEVVYVCADDTHGTPIELSALKRKIKPEQLIEEAHRNHTRDYAGFEIGFDIYYSTNSDEYRRYAELIYQRLREHDLIVEKEINQYYCENDKRFLPDRFIVGTCPKCKSPDQYGDVCEVCGATYDPTDLIDSRCFVCGSKPVMKTSKHLYVQLSKCENFLREYISRPGVLQDDMRNFVQTWIDEGLKEWCISRDGPYFGFRIPGTENKFFYVWLDAPIGYLSSTDRWAAGHSRKTEEFWSPGSDTEIVHFIGKDIVYFHALFWPVMLGNAGFKLPSRIMVHGFLNVQGEKMSKSRGTFILASEYLDKVKHPQAAEFLRFYYGAKLSPTSADIDLNRDELAGKVNTTLANNFGNLHHRTFVFCDRYFEGKVPDAPWDENVESVVNETAREIADFYEKGEFKIVVEKVHALGSLGNKYYQDNQPWELYKKDPGAAARVMVTCANLVKSIAVFLKPIVPELSSRLERQLGMEFGWDDCVFSLRNVKYGKTEKLVQPLESKDLDALFAAEVKSAPAQEDGLLDIDRFRDVQMKIGEIKSAERIEKSSKLLKLKVEIGSETRQIVAGIAQHYSPEQLVGRQVVVVVNLKPAVLFGERSEGMLLAAQDRNGSLVLLAPERTVASGAKVS